MQLTIVIPCFERHDLIQACLRSIDPLDRTMVQVVLVDDGSTPPLETVASPLLTRQDFVFRQVNRGRAAALREGILRANGRYVLLMDSDDEFVPGALDRILSDLARPLSESVVGYVYDCVRYDDGLPVGRLQDGIVATLLSLRADHGFKGDLKEVVLTSVVKESLFSDPGNERRVPTSYIWAGVSMRGRVVSRSLAVVRHRYLAGGMTRSIRQLKKDNPHWLARTYHRIACAPSDAYRSRRFRFANVVKALSVQGAGFSSEHLQALRESVGGMRYAGARLIALLLRAGVR